MTEGEVEHCLVIGVGRGLGPKGGERPPVHGGVDTFGGQVGPLDDAHLDRGATAPAIILVSAATAAGLVV